MPKRIQLKRTKGWRMPENTVKVDRSTRWGNPYREIEQCHSRELALILFRNTARGIWSPDNIPEGWSDDEYMDAILRHHKWLKRLGQHPVELARAELRGKNLACWCSLDSECHADVLLELANQ